MSSTVVKDSPAIYVASLSDYNAGTLHGRWIHIDEDTTADDVYIGIREMLAESNEVGAEEWEIHDTDYWPKGIAHQAAGWDLEDLVKAAHLILEHGQAIACYYEHTGEFNEEGFTDHYLGWWESAESFARDELLEIMDFKIPDQLLAHVNWDTLTRDLMRDRFAAYEGTRHHLFEGEEGVHIFYQG